LGEAKEGRGVWGEGKLRLGLRLFRRRKYKRLEKNKKEAGIPAGLFFSKLLFVLVLEREVFFDKIKRRVFPAEYAKIFYIFFGFD
jgi:hypothetical protein